MRYGARGGVEKLYPYRFFVTRTDPYKVFLHAQERYWGHFQSTNVTLKHSGAPRVLYFGWTATAGAAPGRHQGEWWWWRVRYALFGSQMLVDFFRSIFFLCLQI